MRRQTPDHRDPGAEVSEQLGLLHPDVPATDNDQGLRQLGQLHRGGGRQPVHRVETDHLRDGGGGTGGDQIGPGPQRLAVDGQGVPVQEAGLAWADLEAVGSGHIGVLRITQALDECVLLGHQIAEVHRCG